MKKVTLDYSKKTFVTIKSERDASKYKHIPFNREYGYRKDLASSMNIWGFHTAIIIIKTALFTGKVEYFVIDGQNRLATAIQLRKEVYAEIIEREFTTIEDIVKFMAALNTTQKSWTPDNYVNIWSYLGREDYKILTSIKTKCDFTVTTVAAMLYGFRSRGTVAKRIREGAFKCNLITETEYTLLLSAKLSKYGHLTSRMAIALHYVASLPSFNEDKFIKAYSIHYREIKDNSIDDFSDIFTSWL